MVFIFECMFSREHAVMYDLLDPYLYTFSTQNIELLATHNDMQFEYLIEGIVAYAIASAS